jgi:F0F1-type ATP synthase assembly protein I
MFIPLIGGFVAVVVVTVLIGWILENSSRRAGDQREHH